MLTHTQSESPVVNPLANQNKSPGTNKNSAVTGTIIPFSNNQDNNGNKYNQIPNTQSYPHQMSDDSGGSRINTQAQSPHDNIRRSSAISSAPGFDASPKSCQLETAQYVLENLTVDGSMGSGVVNVNPLQNNPNIRSINANNLVNIVSQPVVDMAVGVQSPASSIPPSPGGSGGNLNYPQNNRNRLNANTYSTNPVPIQQHLQPQPNQYHTNPNIPQSPHNPNLAPAGPISYGQNPLYVAVHNPPTVYTTTTYPSQQVTPAAIPVLQSRTLYPQTSWGYPLSHQMMIQQNMINPLQQTYQQLPAGQVQYQYLAVNPHEQINIQQPQLQSTVVPSPQPSTVMYLTHVQPTQPQQQQPQVGSAYNSSTTGPGYSQAAFTSPIQVSQNPNLGASVLPPHLISHDNVVVPQSPSFGVISGNSNNNRNNQIEPNYRNQRAGQGGGGGYSKGGGQNYYQLSQEGGGGSEGRGGGGGRGSKFKTHDKGGDRSRRPGGRK
jgi:uncharacterized membrane protein YgcG